MYKMSAFQQGSKLISPFTTSEYTVAHSIQGLKQMTIEKHFFPFQDNIYL